MKILHIQFIWIFWTDLTSRALFKLIFLLFSCKRFSKSAFDCKIYTVKCLNIIPYHATIDWSFRVNRLGIVKILILLYYFGKISLDTKLIITYLCFNIVGMLFLIMDSTNESTKSGIFCQTILYAIMNIYHINLSFYQFFQIIFILYSLIVPTLIFT